jgi:hypothetical protein
MTRLAQGGPRSRTEPVQVAKQKALHLVSAFATTSRLVLGQEAVDEKSNEITAIPALLKRLDLEARWSRSTPWAAIPPSPSRSSMPRPTTFLLAVKDNQPTLQADIKSYFDTAPCDEVERFETLGKEHGRIEVRAHTVSHVIDWIAAQRSYPGAPRFAKLTTIAMVESRIERAGKIQAERRSYISSRALSAEAASEPVCPKCSTPSGRTR